jgi:hypothetical protein
MIPTMIKIPIKTDCDDDCAAVDDNDDLDK